MKGHGVIMSGPFLSFICESLYSDNELCGPHQIIRAAADDQIFVSPAQSAEPQQVKYLKGQYPRDTCVDNQEVFVEWIAANPGKKMHVVPNLQTRP
jgi:hypothetical protein